MVIIDEKSHPPPPYVSAPLPPFPLPRPAPHLASLPSHILLKIVYLTFPHSHDERQRKTLYWLCLSLRLVNTPFYVACMHVLRSTYYPLYQDLIRPPYSSDPFPHGSAASPAARPILTLQRETAVLDLFIALKVREDVWSDDSELHLERDESFKDLFDLNQPRSRIEDLVRDYALPQALVSIPSSTTNANANTSNKRPQPIPFSALSVSFSPRKVGLLLNTPGRKRTIVEASRTRDEKLEVTASKLVKQLRSWLASNR